MIRVQEWRPDTCGCRLRMAYDDAEPLDTRQFVTEVVQRCQAHADLVEADAPATVMRENTGKNRVLGRILETAPDDETDTDSRGSKSLRADAVRLTWTGVGKERVLEVETGRSSIDRAALDAWSKANVPDLQVAHKARTAQIGRG